MKRAGLPPIDQLGLRRLQAMGARMLDIFRAENPRRMQRMHRERTLQAWLDTHQETLINVLDDLKVGQELPHDMAMEIVDAQIREICRDAPV